MKIFILNRRKLERMSAKPFKEKTAIISITDFDNSFPELRNKPDYLLRLRFNDVPLGKSLEAEYFRSLSDEEISQIETCSHAMSDEQAKMIVGFYNDICSEADVLICQCEHGESRSAAIAAAIYEYRYGKGIRIFADDRFCPSKSIFRKILETLNTQKPLRNNKPKEF